MCEVRWRLWELWLYAVGSVGDAFCVPAPYRKPQKLCWGRYPGYPTSISGLAPGTLATNCVYPTNIRVVPVIIRGVGRAGDRAYFAIS